MLCGPFRFLLCFAEVDVQEGTDSKALNLQIGRRIVCFM